MNYVLNTKTNTLHLVDGCHHAKNIIRQLENSKLFKTENDVIAKYQKHIKYCKICFKNR